MNSLNKHFFSGEKNTKMVNKKTILITGVIISVLIIAIFTGIYYSSSKESFSVNTILLKLNMPLDGESVNTIKITNNEEIEQEFNVYFNNLKNFASLEEESFNLGAGQSKELKIYFKDNKNQVGIYSGQLIIETLILKKKIPIMLGVEDLNHAFAIIQTSIPKYDNVYPGGKLGIEIKVFDLKGFDLPSVEAEYFIQNFDNEIILSDGGNLIVEGGMSKIIDIPKTLSHGDYVFVTLIDYKETKSIAGYLFSISEKKDDIIPGNLKFFVVVILGFVIGILVLFFYFVKTRDDLLVQLRKQQNKELDRNIELIKYSKAEIKKLKHPEKKIQELKKVKKKIIKKIKLRQSEQRKELKKLKKQGKKTEMKKKLKSWGKQGYKMFETEKEIKRISKHHINRQIKDLKMKGYKTGFLKTK